MGLGRGFAAGLLQGAQAAKMGVDMYYQGQEKEREEELRNLQAEQFNKVDNADAVLAAKDADGNAYYEKVGDNQYRLRGAAAEGEAAGLRDSFKLTSERDAANNYMQAAQARGLMQPMEAMKLRREMKQDDLTDIQLSKAKTIDAITQERLAVLSDPQKMMAKAVELYNSNYGPFGQGEHKGRKVQAFDRGDGTWAVTDMEDGARSRVVSVKEVQDFLANQYFDKIGTIDPSFALKRSEQADTKHYRDQVIQHYKDELAAKSTEGDKNRNTQVEVAKIYAADRHPNADLQREAMELELRKAREVEAAREQLTELYATLDSINSGEAKVANPQTLRDLKSLIGQGEKRYMMLAGKPLREAAAKPVTLGDVPKELQSGIIANNLKFGSGKSIGDYVGIGGNLAEAQKEATRIAKVFPQYAHLVAGAEGVNPETNGDPIGYKPSDEASRAKGKGKGQATSASTQGDAGEAPTRPAPKAEPFVPAAGKRTEGEILKRLTTPSPTDFSAKRTLRGWMGLPLED